MHAGPARTRSTGFSLVELLLTLRRSVRRLGRPRIVDRGTRIRQETDVPLGPEAALQTAFRLLRKDVRGAVSGGLPLVDAVRLVADQTGPAGPGAYVPDGGAAVAVRTGTDQLGLRGAIRSPLVKLDSRVPGADEGVAERMRSRPGEVPVRAPAAPGLDALRKRLAEGPADARRLFFVRDEAGTWAVGRVASVAARSGDGALELVLDFSDPDARARNAAGSSGDAGRLGAVTAGGVFDELVWFVARGLEGRPPDFVLGSDPESLRYPHPFLAVAARTGLDRLGDPRRARRSGTSRSPGASGRERASGLARADAPAGPAVGRSSSIPGAAAPQGSRIALVARAPNGSSELGAPAPEFAVLMNEGGRPARFQAPPRSVGPEPVAARSGSTRETREERVDLGARLRCRPLTSGPGV